MSQLNDLLQIAGEHIKQMRQGVQAFTVQNYIEVNSKIGVQYEASGFTASVTAGTSMYMQFITSDKPVAMKLVDVESSSDSVSYQWFKEPVTSGGTPVTVYNLNEINPVTGNVSVVQNPTVNSDGIPISPEIHIIGQVTQGNKGGGAGGVAGLERILAPNSTYLYKITNTNGTAQDISSYFSWYEGDLDFPKQ